MMYRFSFMILCILVGSTGCDSAIPATEDSNAPKPEPAVAAEVRAKLVRAAKPSREHLTRESVQPAHIEPWEQIDIHAKVSGYVRKLGTVKGEERPLDIGDRVEKDQVLLELWIPEMEQQLEQVKARLERANAEVKQAETKLQSARAESEAAEASVVQTEADIERHKAEVAYRKREYDRFERMFQDQTVQQELVSERENLYQAATAALTSARAALTTARANQKVAVARVSQAEADVEHARAVRNVVRAEQKQTEILLEYGKLKSPFDGVIIARMADTGDFVQSAESNNARPLFSLANVESMRIVTQVPESDSAFAELGQSATLRLDAFPGQSFSGTVARYSDALTPKTRTMRVEVELDHRPKGLRIGQFGTVTLSMGDFPNALVLPTAALVPAGERPTVMLVVDGKAQPREIEIGLNDGKRMQVTAGLTGDELVIIEGAGGVRPGQPVKVVE